MRKLVWSAFVSVSLLMGAPVGCPAELAAATLNEFSTLELPAAQAIAEPSDKIAVWPSPDGQWQALLDQVTGGLDLVGKDDETYHVFPTGSGVSSVYWSSDSRRLLMVRPHYQFDREHQTLLQATQPIEIWQLRLAEQPVMPAALLFRARREEFERDGAQQIVFGQWSPDNRYVVMWVGMLSASILADGLPPFVLDTDTGQTYSAIHGPASGPASYELTAETVALANPRYHSWSPDSSRLAITVGGYRSAQVNKWLNLVAVDTGEVTTVISQTEQIPGIVAWSPQGDLIAYAAVPAELTGDEWADWMTFDNPAIAGRRIYLLDPATGQHRRLNQIEFYQDAPVWGADGSRLYYVQRNGDYLDLMAADPSTGQAEAIPGAREPVDLGDPASPAVGYYGQFGRLGLLDHIPEH